MLENIKESRDEVQSEIETEEQEKHQIEESMKNLSIRLKELNGNFFLKQSHTDECDRFPFQKVRH